MAIRLQRVLIACGLPTILAIVSFYWLRKRRKAVTHSSSPEHSSKEAKSTIDLVLETNKSFMSSNSIANQLKISLENHTLKTNQKDNCCLQLSDSSAMQLRDNKNCSQSAETTTSYDSSNGQQFISTENNSTNPTANQNESNNSNHSSGIKRQMNCENNGNECNENESELNCNYSNISDDNIVFKLSNFSLNNDINDKVIESKENILNDESIRNSTKRDSNCDKSMEEVHNFGQNRLKSVSDSIDANVSSHNDNNDRNDSKSITNALIENNLSETKDKDRSDGQHIPALDSQLIDAQKQNSNQISVEVSNCGNNTSDGLIMSQTNSIEHNTSSACSSSASCQMTNGYEAADMYHNYPDSVSNGVHSPPHSAFSDAHSEGSSDSGKGGSDILHATPIEGPNLTPSNEPVVYQFEIPQYLCGRLIGSGGRFVAQIKRHTNTSLVINKHVFSSDMKICTLTGTKSEIREALNQIRMRFPIADYPEVTLQQINLLNPTPTCPLPAQTCQLQLPSGISCDVILSSLVSAGHFFLQQPTHPTYPSLSRLDLHMTQTYSQQTTPLLPTIHPGMICAVPIMGGWYRAVITKVYDIKECDVMFVDYGGYSRLPVSSLRQIRYDFMSLPFQASECYLANVQPINAEKGWTAEANALFEELAQGQILQAFIVGFSDNGIPLVNLFKIQGISNVFINQELVDRSHAQWIDNSV